MTQKYTVEPRVKIPSTVRPTNTRATGATPGWVIVLASIAPGLAFVGGIITGRWGM
jgi:hypothetical protein